MSKSEQSYKYNSGFSNNILIIRQTGCTKTTIVQNLARNKMFGNLKSVDWISKIKLSKSREINVSSCFSQTSVKHHYPKDISIDEKDELTLT